MMILYSILWVFLVLLCPCIVLSNILILCVWFRYKRLRTPSNILIVSLSSCDLGIGLLIPSFLALDLSLQDSAREFPVLITQDYQNTSGAENTTVVDPRDERIIPACDNMVYCVHFLVMLILSSMELLSIGSIALDRFLSVSEPLRYNHFVTMNTGYRFLLAAWVYSFLVCIFPIIFYEDASTEVLICYISIFIYVPSLLVALGSYGFIFVIARSHAKQIFSVEISLHDATGGITDIPQSVVTHSSGQHRYGLTLNLLIGSLLCWAPVHAVAALAVLGNSSFILHQHRWRLLAIAPIGLSILANPWLYAYRSSEVRNAVIRILDNFICKVTGRPTSYGLFLQNKDAENSCASNVRLLAISPTQTSAAGSHVGTSGVSGSNLGSHVATPSRLTTIEPNQNQLHVQVLCEHQISAL